MKIIFQLLIISSLITFCIGASVAQKWSFGPQLGITVKPTGQTINAELGTMIVVGNDYFYGHPVYGVFVNYKVADFLSAKSAINYYSNFTSYLVWNTAEQTPYGITGLGPVPKANVVTHNTIEVPINIYLRVPFFTKNFEFGALLGLNNQFYFGSSSDPYNMPRWPLESEVFSSLHNSAKKYVLVPSYGISVTLFDRAEISGRYYKVNDYIKPVDYLGETYRVNSIAEYLIISVGYKFYSLKKKDNE